MARYQFTREDRVKGGKQRFQDIMEREPELLLWLKKRIRAFNTMKKEREANNEHTDRA